MTDDHRATLHLTAVLVAVTGEAPRILITRESRGQSEGQTPVPLVEDSPNTLPTGPFEPHRHRTLDQGCRQWVENRTGLHLHYVEQLYSFGSRYRDPREYYGAPRFVSVAYLGLTKESPISGHGCAGWRDWYSFLPWEDWRDRRPALIDQTIRPRLLAWIDGAESEAVRLKRRERADICFSLFGAAGFDPVRAHDRYELLYEAGLLPEALRDAADHARATGNPGAVPDSVRLNAAAQLGEPMALDTRRILAGALTRLRGKLAYRPVVFDLLPETFTLLRLQRVVEALFGAALHKQNFRRTVTGMELVEATGALDASGRGRPAELYRFRREALLERRTLGIGIPTLRAHA